MSPQWRVGDACRTAWSGDGRIYPARLRVLHPDTGTCLVEFDGYGNTEERALADLLPPHPAAWGASDTPGGEDPPSSAEPPPGSRRRRKGKQPPCSPRPPKVSAYHPPAFGAPHAPPAVSLRGWGCCWQAMPPPWSPFLLRSSREEEEEEEAEALAAMLMAWYMSGYHTGFYVVRRGARGKWDRGGKEGSPPVTPHYFAPQGLREGRTEAAQPPPRPGHRQKKPPRS